MKKGQYIETEIHWASYFLGTPFDKSCWRHTEKSFVFLLKKHKFPADMKDISLCSINLKT